MYRDCLTNIYLRFTVLGTVKVPLETAVVYLGGQCCPLWMVAVFVWRLWLSVTYWESRLVICLVRFQGRSMVLPDGMNLCDMDFRNRRLDTRLVPFCKFGEITKLNVPTVDRHSSPTFSCFIIVFLIFLLCAYMSMWLKMKYYALSILGFERLIISHPSRL